MKNRAKCRLCNSIIESFHRYDYVTCKCGEIAIDGGLDEFRVTARDYANFLRIDDEGNEIIVKVKEKSEPEQNEPDVKQLDIDTRPSRNDLIKMLDNMSKNVENLPEHAKLSYITQYDFGALISLLHMIFKTNR